MSRTSYCALSLEGHVTAIAPSPFLIVGKDRKDLERQKRAHESSSKSTYSRTRSIPHNLANNPAFVCAVDGLLKDAYRHQLKKDKA